MAIWHIVGEAIETILYNLETSFPSNYVEISIEDSCIYNKGSLLEVLLNHVVGCSLLYFYIFVMKELSGDS